MPSFLTQGLPAVAPLITAGGGLAPEGIGNLAALLPGVEVLAEWRGPEHLAGQEASVLAFLRRRTPRSRAAGAPKRGTAGRIA